MTPDTVLRRRSLVEHIDIEGEVLLYDDLHLRLLPGIATEIWRHVDGWTSAGQIAADIAVNQGVDPSQVAVDVLDYLQDLLDHRLLELAPGEASTLVRPPPVGWVRDDDAVLLVHCETGRRQALTTTGSRIWELTCDGDTVAEIVTTLRQEYADVPDSLA